MNVKINTAIVPITYKCNLHCNFCFASAKGNIDSFMSIDYFKSKVDELKKLGLKQIVLTGGEPLMHPKIGEIVSIANSCNLDIQLLTNGTSPKILNIAHSINNITISIDGRSKNHDHVRGRKGSLEKAVNTLQLLNDKTSCSITMTVSEKNFSDIEYVYLLGMELEVSSITINPVVAEGRAKDQILYTNFYDKVFLELKRIYKKYGFRIPMFTSLSTLENFQKNLPKLIFNLYSSVWFDQNNNYSLFPLPMHQDSPLIFRNLASLSSSQTFTHFLIEENHNYNPEEVIDTHSYLKKQFLRFLVEEDEIVQNSFFRK